MTPLPSRLPLERLEAGHAQREHGQKSRHDAAKRRRPGQLGQPRAQALLGALGPVARVAERCHRMTVVALPLLLRPNAEPAGIPGETQGHPVRRGQPRSAALPDGYETRPTCIVLLRPHRPRSRGAICSCFVLTRATLRP